MFHENATVFDDKKVAAMFLGHFLGDALGLPFEFAGYKIPRAPEKIQLNIPMDRVGRYGHETHLDVGQTSDDSEMTIILASHMVRNNFSVLDEKQLVGEYQEWANHPTCFGLGKNTRQLFKGVRTYNGYLKRMVSNGKISESNGAMMRCSSLALAPDESTMMILAEADCKLTNPAPVAIVANKTYLTLLRRVLLTSSGSLDMQAALTEVRVVASQHDAVRNVVEEAVNGVEREIACRETKGWCLHALYCVVYCMTRFTNYSDAVSWVIQRGGDTDTNACIVGAVFGALVGLPDLLQEQTANLHVLLTCTTNGGGNKPRPPKYVPYQFLVEWFGKAFVEAIIERGGGHQPRPWRNLSYEALVETVR